MKLILLDLSGVNDIDAVSIDELERITGLDFLTELPDDVETALEAATPTRLWPTGMIGLCRLLRERFRSYD